jgi:hypothetical protein
MIGDTLFFYLNSWILCIDGRIKRAKLPYIKAVHDIDFAF